MANGKVITQSPESGGEPIGGGQTSIKAVPAGQQSSGFLTPGQMRQVAFIHSVTSARCACGDLDNCNDCQTTHNMKELAGRHLGIL